MISCELAGAPKFNAISYTWGAVEPQRTINVSGRDVTVRPNCFYAMWQARDYCRDLYVWIDSICINQDDLIEKGAQVAIMGKIYARAEKVLACIGDDDDSCRFIRHFIEVKIAEELGPTLQPERGHPPVSSEHKQLFSELRHHWERFCQRRYFHRIWVVQELFEGRGRLVLLCGISAIDWSSLVTLYHQLLKAFGPNYENSSTNSATQNFCLETIQRLGVLINTGERGMIAFGTLMSLTRALECEDPRDRVFGTLLLIDWEGLGATPPKPDYNCSCFDVATDLVTRLSITEMQDVRTIATVLRLDRELQEDLERFALQRGQNA